MFIVVERKSSGIAVISSVRKRKLLLSSREDERKQRSPVSDQIPVVFTKSIALLVHLDTRYVVISLIKI